LFETANYFRHRLVEHLLRSRLLLRGLQPGRHHRQAHGSLDPVAWPLKTRSVDPAEHEPGQERTHSPAVLLQPVAQRQKNAGRVRV